ncbi:hypothetical protein [Candidatus Uabimicrobium sp. HlEnr_7]|uniref:hypothetical protein n=1 Tax=Candidatus Uabimicrobium helgolandensis TaxID=3095367 RepID=UPI003558253C
MKIFLSLCIFFALCFVHAQDLEIDIFSGYGNTLPHDASLEPVLVVLNNKGKGLIKGKLVITQVDYLPTSNGRFYTQEVILPGNSNKIVKYYVLLSNSHASISVSLKTENKTFKKKKDFKVRPNDKPIWINWQKGIKKNKNYKEKYYNIASTPIQAFPKILLALNHVSVMFVDNPQNFVIDEEQTEVLRLWLARGGSLIFASTLGLETVVSRKISFCKVGFPTKKTSFATTNFNLGRIICFRQDKEHPFFKNMYTNHNFVNKTLRYSHSVYKEYYTSSLQKSMSESLSGEVKFTWMILLLIAYLAFIGPIDYWLTKKFKNRMLTWWIYIASIIIFSFLAYLKGYILKSGPMKMNCLNYIDMYDDGQIFGKTVFGIYSTRNSNYTMTNTTQNGLLLPLNSDVALDNEFFDTSSLFTRIPIYSSKNYLSTWNSNIPIQKQSIRIKKDKKITISVPKNIEITDGYLIAKKKLNRIIVLGETWYLDSLDYRFPGKEKKLLLSYSSSHNNYSWEQTTVKDVEKLLDATRNLAHAQIIILFCDLKNYVQVVGENPIRKETSVLRYVVPVD